MRLPSIEQLARAGRQSAGRFPLVLMSAAVAAAAGSLLPDSSIDREIVGGLLYASSLGIPLFFALDLVAERRGTRGRDRWIARGIAVGILVAIYAVRPTWSEQVQVLRYVQLSMAVHLLVAVAPYAGVREWNGFWQYNRSLLLRFLMAAVFSGVLYVGLTIALLAVDNLLGVSVEEETYLRMWCVIAFLFNTWFFVAGVPDHLPALDRRDDYPPALKVLAQYVLSPLVTIYMLILTAYLARILITRVWPSGWIGYLVSSVAAAGILSLLLLYPIEEREENRWVRRYARWFYFGLIPADIMLMLAIFKRIQQYSFTEPRYFLVVLSLWLAGISLFYVISRSRNIKVIPASLAIIALATFVGPWSAYAVSRQSQTARLEGLLQRNGMLVDGQVQRPAGEVPAEDRKEIGAVVRYLAMTHGTGSIEGWFPEGRLAEVDTVAGGTEPTGRRRSDERAALIVGELGLEYIGSWTPGEGEAFRLSADRKGPPLSIAGYDYVVRDRDFLADTIRVDEPALEFVFDEERLAIVATRDADEVLSVPLTPLIEKAIEASKAGAPDDRIPPDVLAVGAEAEDAAVLLAVTSIRGFIRTDVEDGEAGAPYRLTSLSADLFFRLAEPEASDMP